jgi:hypothetical protein
LVTIVAGNGASVGVARRAGFVYEGTMRAHGVWLDQRGDVIWFAALPLERQPPDAFPATRDDRRRRDRRAGEQ